VHEIEVVKELKKLSLAAILRIAEKIDDCVEEFFPIVR
jgi:hypothetical protein